MINKNQPAFPRPASEYTASGTLSDSNDAIKAQEGMSIRQVYAAKAMQGLIESGIAFDGNHQPKIVAKLSYEYADAMIAFENNEKENK